MSKTYDLEGGKLRLVDALPFAHRRPRRPLRALADVDLDVGAGESVGLIGSNGAGKSTLLKVVAGVTAPTRGSVEVAGRVGSMIELGLGFLPDMSGWENVRCSGRLLGHSNQEIDDAASAIAEFSGIESFLDEPLKTYSTGMRARLGFAVATQFPVELLVVDEVLAVGDREFQERCLDRIDALVAAGTSVMFVSHDMSLVTRACSRAVQLRDGRLVDDGPALDVVERYLSNSSRRAEAPRRGSLSLVDISLRSNTVTPWDPIEFRGVVEVAESVEDAVLGVALFAPTHTPERPFVESETSLGQLAPGTYVVDAATSEFPGEGGLVRMEVGLFDGARGQCVGRQTFDLSIEGASASTKPHLAVTPRWTTTPADVDVARRDGSAVRSGAESVASLDAVTKTFPEERSRVRDLLPGSRRRSGRTVVAVRDMTLEFGRGTSVGLIGPNGAGKSTVLRLLAAVVRPDAGRIRTTGRVVPLLDVHMGLHLELTGEHNVRVAGRLLGMSKSEVERMLPDVARFAELEDVMDVPLKRYSSGMRARLGFALAAHSSPDVLLIDENLAVGDERFRSAAVAEVGRLRETGVTVVFVSHELRLVEEMCEFVVRLENGEVVDAGPTDVVLAEYGGPSWSAAVRDASSGIRFRRFHVRRRRIAVGEAVEFSGELIVEEPSPWARVELSYRIAPAEGEVLSDPVEIADRTFFVQTVEPAGGALAVAGTYTFSGAVERNLVQGEFDLVLSVVDGRESETLSEAWKSVVVGHRTEAPPGPALELVATVTAQQD